MNIIVRLEFELAYFDAAVQHFCPGHINWLTDLTIDQLINLNCPILMIQQVLGFGKNSTSLRCMLVRLSLLWTQNLHFTWVEAICVVSSYRLSVSLTLWKNLKKRKKKKRRKNVCGRVFILFYFIYEWGQTGVKLSMQNDLTIRNGFYY